MGIGRQVWAVLIGDELTVDAAWCSTEGARPAVTEIAASTRAELRQRATRRSILATGRGYPLVRRVDAASPRALLARP
jgi:hypothetical protein